VSKTKRKRKSPVSTDSAGYEVITPERIRDAVTKLVDYCETQKMPAKIVLLAMEHITSKIRDHLQIETIEIADVSKSKH